jgi:hypothetical protein
LKILPRLSGRNSQLRRRKVEIGGRPVKGR